MAAGKEYGLIIPSKAKANAVIPIPTGRGGNVFGDESDEEQDGVDWVKQALKKQSYGSVQQKQSTQVMKKAIEDDPTVYQYDEVYDQMNQKRIEAKEKAKKDKKPKYIENLLKTAERRNREHEQRIERQVQVEREKEGDMFQDKEAFVTGAYRKKMEELQRIQEEENRKDAIDDMTDVTKQKDLSGFYRHLYRQTLDEDTKPVNTVVEGEIGDVPKVPEVQDVDSHVANIKIKEEPNDSGNEPDENIQPFSQPIKSESVAKIKHDGEVSDSSRHRRKSSDRTDSRYPKKYREEEGRRRERSGDRHHRQDKYRRSPERDRHRHRRSRSRSRSNERSRRQGRGRYYEKQEKRTEDNYHRRSKEDSSHEERSSKKHKPSSTTVKIEPESENTSTDKTTVAEVTVRSTIWNKRTVGTVFEDALQRYLNRKKGNILNSSVVTGN